MAHSGRYHGGLVFAESQENVLDQFSKIVSTTLKDYGHHVEKQSMMSAERARITASQYLVKLNLGVGFNPSRHTTPTIMRDVSVPNPKGAELCHRLEISLCAADPTQSDQTHSELLLVVMMYRMAEAFAADYVEWLDPKTVLTSQDFLSAFASVSPRRVRSRKHLVEARNANHAPFAPIEETVPELETQCNVIAAKTPFDSYVRPISISEQKALSHAFRLDEYSADSDTDDIKYVVDNENNVRRMASWGMTGMLFFVSTPVAATMAALNLINGENFRLNTQVLAFSGLLVALKGTGALAEAVSYLPF